MFGQFFVGDPAPREDLQHLFVAFMQQPRADARLAIRRDKVYRPIARRYIDQNTMHKG